MKEGVMGEVDKKYMPFWKWWVHRSESTPSLDHKTNKRTASKFSRDNTSSSSSRHVMSSEELYERPRESEKGVKSTEELFLRSLEDGNPLGRTDGVDEALSPESYRRYSTSQLSRRPSSLERTVSLRSTRGRGSRSVSSLELKNAYASGFTPRGEHRGQVTPTSRYDSRAKEKTSGGHKRRLTLGLGRLKHDKKKERKGSNGSKTIDSDPASAGYDTVDNRSHTIGGRHFDFGVDKQDVEKSPGYDIMTPTEIYEKRTSKAKSGKDGDNVETTPGQGSASQQNETNSEQIREQSPSPEGGMSTSNPDTPGDRSQDGSGGDSSKKDTERERSASELTAESVTGRAALKDKVESVKTQSPDMDGSYSVPGPPRPIYDTPPPPIVVAATRKARQDGGATPQHSKEVSGEVQKVPESPRREGFPERPLPSPPSADPKLDEAKQSSGDRRGSTTPGSTVQHTDVQRTRSEQPPTPKVVKKHQMVRRTRSEPRTRRSDYHPLNLALTKTDTEAMQTVIDDHLIKHNIKVMNEAGVDIAALPPPLHKPAIKTASNASTTSAASSVASFRTRPSTLDLPSQAGNQPVSGLTQERPSYDPQFYGSRSSSLRSKRSSFKPAPPVRSPTTKLTTVGRRDSTSSQSSSSSKLSTPGQQVVRRANSLTSVFMVQDPSGQKVQPYAAAVATTQTFSPTFPYQGPSRPGLPVVYQLPSAAHTAPPGGAQQHLTRQTASEPRLRKVLAPAAAQAIFTSMPPSRVSPPVVVDAVHKPRRWSLTLSDLAQYQQATLPSPGNHNRQLKQSSFRNYQQHVQPSNRGTASHHLIANRDVARVAVGNWVAHRLAQFPPEIQSLYIGHKWSYSRGRSRQGRPQPIIHEEVEDEMFQTHPPVSPHRMLKTKSSSDSDHSVGGLRTASLDRLGRRSHAHPAAHAHAHTPHYTLPRRPQNAQRYSQPQSKGKGYGYSPPSAVFDDDPGIMSEAETSSTGFRRGGKQRASLPVSRTPSTKTLDSRNFEMEETNSYWDEDPGIMSEAETSSTGRGRNLKPRTSLPIVRTPSKTLERPLGLVFLQFRGETKRALLPNEITSLDTVKALFVRSFPNQLTMQYLDLPSVKIYIHDSNKDMFYDLEDLGGTCFISRRLERDIRDRSVLRVFEGEGVNGQGGGAWEQDQSYFSEPEFDSDFQQQHVHNKSKSGKSGGYYMTHSYPPGAPQPNAGVAPIPRGPRPPYPADVVVSAAGGVAPPKPQRYAGAPGGPAGGPPGLMGMKGGLRPSAPPPGPPTGPPDGPRPQHMARSYSSYSSSPERLDLLYSSQERMHGDGYLSSPERSPRPYGGSGSSYLTPTPSYEDPYYGGQYGSRSGSVTPIIDEEARSAFYSMRVEQMERQLASLTGLVQKALHTGVASSPRPEIIPLAPPPAVVAAAAAAAAAAAQASSNTERDGAPPPPNRATNDFLQVPTSSSFSKSSAEKQPIKPAIKCSTLPRMSSQDSLRNIAEPLRPSKPAPSSKPQPPPKPPNLMLTRPSLSLQNSTDLRLSPEVYNQLRVLQKKAKELRTDVRNLRKTSQANALTMKEILRDTVTKITTLLQSNEASLLQGSADAERVRIQREEASYRQDMTKLDKDLCDLELKVEELRNNVINRRLRVNMSDVENMALILSRSSKTVADLKAKFPILQDGLKGLISAEMEKAFCNEKFLKEEPDKLESALRRCKKLTGTLVTLKRYVSATRLASVQEQRVPPNAPGGGPIVGVANGDPRATSPTPAEDVRASSAKQPGVVASPHLASAAGVGADGQPRLRAENALDALLDELQTFARPPSEASSRKSSVDVTPATPLATMAPASFTVTSALTTSTGVRRLPSFPSSDSQSSPVKSPANVFPGASSTLPRAASQAPLPPPRDEHRLSFTSTSSGSARSSPRSSISGEPHRLPPPPPPRTSSRSPMLSPSSPMSPAPRSVSVPPGGIVATMVGGVLRNAEGRELYGPVLRQRPPLGRGSFSEDSTASSASTNSSTSSAKAGQLSSNSSSTESVNSQEGAGPRQQNTSNVPPTPPPKQRQENLEARHLELLRRQKQLQEQYQRLQSLQRSGGRPTPSNIDLKKTGSESNLTARLGLSLAPAAHGSLSNLTSPNPPSHTNTLPNPKTSSAASTGGIDPHLTTKRSSGGLVETDIL
ncbi:uncharacterized protein LOC121875141 isoform X13 [Homarus americanus]|uniref:uncharacterized protein LOC121875141 isoform X13 n=1 Tax=Homarus americanus TaxID=6706 RepID=UPI001C496A85|nr:uncharacterized protein LOC121875141 isoform X13 [Homarus americanus]